MVIGIAVVPIGLTSYYLTSSELVLGVVAFAASCSSFV
jgi:hypothetical protein